MAIIFTVFPLSEGGDVDSPDVESHNEKILETCLSTLPLMTVAEYVLNGSCSYICLRDFAFPDFCHETGEPWWLRSTGIKT